MDVSRVSDSDRVKSCPGGDVYHAIGIVCHLHIPLSFAESDM